MAPMRRRLLLGIVGDSAWWSDARAKDAGELLGVGPVVCTCARRRWDTAWDGEPRRHRHPLLRSSRLQLLLRPTHCAADWEPRYHSRRTDTRPWGPS